MTNVTSNDRERKRLARKARREDQERYGLTRSTKAFIAVIVILLVALISGAILYLTLALNDARNVDRNQDIAISEWSRRYVSLYDQYSTKVGEKPVSLSPSAVQYLINTETTTGSASAIPGLPTGGGGTGTPPNWSYNINIDGKNIKFTCVPASDYDPVAPSYNCK